MCEHYNARKRAIFAALVEAEDAALARRVEDGLPAQDAIRAVKAEITERFHISSFRLESIIKDGIFEEWPPLNRK